MAYPRLYASTIRTKERKRTPFGHNQIRALECTDVSDNAALAARVRAASHLTGTFLLRSGKTSTEYFDKYLFEADPELLAAIVDGLTGLVPAGTEVLAGLELGGVPLATLLSQRTGLPTRFVRKKAKEYGTRRIAEGGEVTGRRVVLVEDVVTSGGAVLDATKVLRDDGAVVEDVLCVIDRSEGGRERLAELGLTLRPLLTRAELDAAAAR
ncbi:orotate phosphoribosyltransferase [Frankia sp. QA3]|nr:orotate phosphoribosyltransferase [Frankia sp. QA3]